MKFVLNKAKWLRGEGGAKSTLCRSDGKMCCLGQLAEQCGFEGELEGSDSPRHLPSFAERATDALRWTMDRDGSDSPDACDAMSINDDEELGDTERINRLRPIFARHGIEMEVVES